MLHFIINFCLITFICYAMAYPVKAILFSGGKKQRTAVHASASHKPRAMPKRRAKLVLLPKKAARKHLRAA